MQKAEVPVLLSLGPSWLLGGDSGARIVHPTHLLLFLRQLHGQLAWAGLTEAWGP